MSLSLTDGLPIAEINGKNKRSKTVYINTESDNTEPEIDSPVRDLLLPNSFYTGLKNVSPANMILLKRAIRLSQPNILPTNNDNLKNAYERSQELLNELLRRNIDLPKAEGTIQVIPNDAWNGAISVFGQSGSGKSTWISNYLKVYKRKFPKNKIYVLSPILDDPAFAPLKPEYVKIDGSIVEDPLDVSEFKNSILVFDDIESIKNKDENQAIQHFRDSVLETGRHHNVEAICVSHVLLNGNSTKKMLNESNYIVVFPNSNFNAIKNFCSRYIGMSRDDINWIKQCKSRWVCISKRFPTTLITENQIKFL